MVKFKVSSEDDRVTGLSGKRSVEPGSAPARLRLRVSIARWSQRLDND